MIICSVRVKHCVPEAEQRGGWCLPPSPYMDVPPGDADWVPGSGRFPFPRYTGIPRSQHWRTAPSWLGSLPPTTEPAVLLFGELNYNRQKAVITFTVVFFFSCKAFIFDFHVSFTFFTSQNISNTTRYCLAFPFKRFFWIKYDIVFLFTRQCKM